MVMSKNYHAAYTAMARSKIPSPWKTAMLLMDAFLIGHNKLTAEAFYKAEIKGFKNFTEWRDFLCSKNWLCFELIEDKYPQYSPGLNLIKYVTREKEANGTIASLLDVQTVSVELEKTKDELTETKTKLDLVESRTESELRLVKERLTLMEKAVESLITEYDPPVTQEKVAKRLKIVNTQNIVR